MYTSLYVTNNNGNNNNNNNNNDRDHNDDNDGDDDNSFKDLTETFCWHDNKTQSQ